MPRLLKVTISSIAMATALGLVAAFWVAPSGADDKSKDKDRHESPDAIWSVPKVDVSIKPGETQQIQVTLTARDKLGAGVVRVVPALVPYLQVAPTTTPKLRKRETQVFTLTFFARIDALPTTLEGAIQLRKHGDKRKIGESIAKPLPVMVQIDWPTIASPGGVTISYPGTFALYEQLNALTDTVTLTNFGGVYASGGLIPAGGADIVVADLPPLTETLEAFLARKLSNATIEAHESVLVDGRNATRVTYTESFTPAFSMRYVEIYVPLPQMLHKLSLAYNVSDPSEPEFLSSFQVLLNSIRLPN